MLCSHCLYFIYPSSILLSLQFFISMICRNRIHLYVYYFFDSVTILSYLSLYLTHSLYVLNSRNNAFIYYCLDSMVILSSIYILLPIMFISFNNTPNITYNNTLTMVLTVLQDERISGLYLNEYLLSWFHINSSNNITTLNRSFYNIITILRQYMLELLYLVFLIQLYSITNNTWIILQFWCFR